MPRMTMEEINAYLYAKPWAKMTPKERQAHVEALGNVLYYHLDESLQSFQSVLLQQGFAPHAAAVFHGASMFLMRIAADFCYSQCLEEPQQREWLNDFLHKIADHFEQDWVDTMQGVIDDHNLALLDSVTPNNKPN